MPDAWGADRGFDPETADHDGDGDADGCTNIEAYLQYNFHMSEYHYSRGNWVACTLSKG